MKLKDKWALVTGGSRGIGRGICFELAREGCNIIVNYVSSTDKAIKTVTEIKCLGVDAYALKADVSDRDAVNKMFKIISERNELDIVIGNAGVVEMQPFLEITKEAWDFQININLVGSFNIGQEAAKNFAEQGYKGVKQRACAGPSEGKKGMERNEMLVKTVREAVGDNISIMIDPYMSWAEIDYAVEMIKRLDKYNLDWVEEPLLPDDFEGYKYLRSKVETPIAAGEHEFTKFGHKDLIVNRVVDIIQPDIRRMGGLTEAKKVATLAEAFGIPYAPHVAYAETIHLVVSCPMVRWAEDICVPSWEKEKQEGGFSDAYIIGAPKAENGFIEVDDTKPGLGIELNMEVIEKLRI
ncbi:L-rhamnonate dehydratase [subsurface metagenome]